MVLFLTTLAVAATTVTVHADRTTNSSANPVVRCNKTLFSARSRASLDGRVPSAISVGVFAPLDVTESLVIRVFDEANAIWGPTEIAFDWHRVTSDRHGCRVASDRYDRRREKRFRRTARRLGLDPVYGRRSCTVVSAPSRVNAEALIGPTPGVTGATIVGHEILIGRALGRALSHEMGHYLLKSKLHTPHGLMRATGLPTNCFQTTGAASS